MKINIVYIFIIFILYIYKINALVPFRYGDQISMECKDDQGNWKKGPICSNDKSKQELSVFYGRDSPLYCSIFIDESELNRVKGVLSQNKSWECRIPVSADITESIYVPISIQLWGYTIEDHLDINTHYNFILHVENGILIGASLYPVKDKFQTVQKGTMFTLHGKVKWFNGPIYLDLNDPLKVTDTDGLLVNLDYWIITLWVILSLTVSFLSFSLFYKYYLKPKLLRRYLKTD